MKQRIAPSHSNMAKPPNICLQNFTHSGMVFGGDNAFGPSRAKISATLASVKPYEEISLRDPHQFHSKSLPFPDEYHIVEKVHQLVLYDHPIDDDREGDSHRKRIKNLTISNSRFRSSRSGSTAFLPALDFFSLV